MEPAYRLAAAFRIRIAFKHISGEVLRAWVVDCVHADCCRAVVLGYADFSAETHFQPRTSAATAAEKIDNNLVVLRVEAQAVLGFEIEWWAIE
ncbi:Unknown protein sequence [Pseudomonas syringae pv. maculicola]|nr:Unknown protein sequence [Pseudomonas syringae pv. maculicola]